MDGIDYILNLNLHETHPNLCGLSQNEARVLYSVVKWPHLSDQVMFRKIGEVAIDCNQIFTMRFSCMVMGDSNL